MANHTISNNIGAWRARDTAADLKASIFRISRSRYALLSGRTIYRTVKSQHKKKLRHAWVLERPPNSKGDFLATVEQCLLQTSSNPIPYSYEQTHSAISDSPKLAA